MPKWRCIHWSFYAYTPLHRFLVPFYFMENKYKKKSNQIKIKRHATNHATWHKSCIMFESIKHKTTLKETINQGGEYGLR